MIYIRYFVVTENDSSGPVAGTDIGSQSVAAYCDLGDHTRYLNSADGDVADVLVSPKA
jgi:hypothetical protein